MRLEVTLLVLIGFTLGCSCGRTTTLGVTTDEPDGGAGEAGGAGGQAGEAGSAGAGMGGSSNAGGSTSGGNGGASSSTGGSAGVTATGGTAGSDAGPVDHCKLPVPTPSTPAEIGLENLIRTFCTAALGSGCSPGSEFGFVSGQLADCSHEDRLRGCMIDTYNDYFAWVNSPECDAAWRAAAACLGKVGYTQGRCPVPIIASRGAGPHPCDAEKDVLDACQLSTGGGVTGTHGYCGYGPDPFDPGDCAVLCDSTGAYFEASCGGPPELPLTCHCYLNGHIIWDDADGMAAPFLAADCRDAALRMVEGTCFERVDCCFTWQGPETPPQQHCSCTSDPRKIQDPGAPLGYETCEDAASAKGGQVVSLCPQYTQNPGCLNDPQGCI